jgi:hypothetical protein
VALALAATGCKDVALAEEQGKAKATKKAKPSKTAKTGKAKVDPKADELLRAMSADLVAAKSFQVDAKHVHEVVTDEGQKLQVLAQARIAAKRPNMLRSDRTGAIADLTLYYDGKNLTIYGKKTKMYASAPAPGTIDKAIEFARDELGLEAPGADLLYSDVYEGLMSDVVSGEYLSIEPVGDRMCHHLAYRGSETDWQIWIEDGDQALPCRYVITSKNVEGQPQYSVELDNWNVSTELAADHFAFTPPKDATKIEFLSMDKAKAKAKKGSKQP